VPMKDWKMLPQSRKLLMNFLSFVVVFGGLGEGVSAECSGDWVEGMNPVSSAFDSDFSWESSR